MYRIFAAGFAVASIALPCAAQPTLPQGARVRVLVTNSSPAPSSVSAPQAYVGTLRSTGESRVVIDTGSGAPIALALGSIRRIDVSRGRPNRRLIGSIIGGAISGGIFVAAACAFSDGSCDIGSHVGGFVAYYAVGAIPGVFIGGAIGSHHYGAERWREAWAPPRVGLGLQVSPDRGMAGRP